jgi:hypothetical protein
MKSGTVGMAVEPADRSSCFAASNDRTREFNERSHLCGNMVALGEHREDRLPLA